VLSWEYPENEGAFRACSWRGEPVALTIGGREGNICVFAVNLRTRERTILCGPVDSLHRAQFTPDTRRALVCTQTQPDTYELWDLEAVSRCGSVTGADFRGLDPLLSADGRYLVAETRSGDGLVVWDPLHNRLARRIEFDSYYVPLAMSPTHLVVVVVANSAERQIDRTLFLDACTGACLGETSGHVMCMGGALFSPCGRRFGSAI
jgi:hypothetical protein